MEIYNKLIIDIKDIVEKKYWELEEKENFEIWEKKYKKYNNEMIDEYLSHIKQLDKYITHNNDCSLTWFSGFKGYFGLKEKNLFIQILF